MSLKELLISLFGGIGVSFLFLLIRSKTPIKVRLSDKSHRSISETFNVFVLIWNISLTLFIVWITSGDNEMNTEVAKEFLQYAHWFAILAAIFAGIFIGNIIIGIINGIRKKDDDNTELKNMEKGIEEKRREKIKLDKFFNKIDKITKGEEDGKST